MSHSKTRKVIFTLKETEYEEIKNKKFCPLCHKSYKLFGAEENLEEVEKYYHLTQEEQQNVRFYSLKQSFKEFQ